VSNLGIVTDNPSSAEAMYADDRRLVTTARRQNRVMGASPRRVARKIVRLRDDVDVTDGLRRLDVSWAKPEFTSPGSPASSPTSGAPRGRPRSTRSAPPRRHPLHQASPTPRRPRSRRSSP